MSSRGFPPCQVERETRARTRQEICGGQSPTAFWRRSVPQLLLGLDSESQRACVGVHLSAYISNTIKINIAPPPWISLLTLPARPCCHWQPSVEYLSIGGCEWMNHVDCNAWSTAQIWIAAFCSSLSCIYLSSEPHLIVSWMSPRAELLYCLTN